MWGVVEPPPPQFGSNEHFTHFLSRRVVQTQCIEFQQHHRIRGGKRLHRRNTARLLGRIRQHMRRRKRNEFKCLTTRVQIQSEVAHRQQHALKIVGDFFRDAAIGLAGKYAVQVSRIDG